MSRSIKWSGYLTVSCPGVSKEPNRSHLWKPQARLSVNKPSVSPCEVAVKIEVNLPETLFIRPALEASITVPDNAVTPPKIDMEISDRIQELIVQNLGFDVRVVPVEGRPH